MATATALLLDRHVLLLDGGLGTTLEDEHGAQFSTQTPLWSSHLLVENPALLQTVQQDFANAGADILLTATYQASFQGFKKTKVKTKAKALSDDGIDAAEATKYMLSAITIARNAFSGRPGLVALSLGAYGATMVPSTEYSGEYGALEQNDLFQFHMERLSAFTHSEAWADVDLVAFETLPRIDEVRAARQVMRAIASTDKQYWISCVFPNDDDRLPDGTEIEELVTAMLDGGRKPLAIGFNCTKIHKVTGLVRRFEDAAQALSMELPRLFIYPDGAGDKVYDTQLQRWVGDDRGTKPWDQQVFEIVREIRHGGAWKGIIVGGCCKTTPGHITKLRKRLDELEETE
ncbi:hypothetical protein A1O3_05758 [Capronia epimyces CBS 606.96]|uniref:Hcy-binding domain-containing protein n=1 Tax=Capronia epimyces CBS 606.96 TaxID=1182542 RepID=W9XXW8_9EURO|nr:uncharacterized protein A1O3_05758 [Capronia epimyces CBS 606.96]EXJ85083.1 hypothetical protein A1O3_05758 [Capronia epimyces CBS 606.96]